MLEYDFEQSIGYWVVMTAKALENALNEELAPQGITFRQWQVLAWLAHDGNLSQSELAERLRIEPPTLVRILDRMERQGWIERRPAASDRRKKLIAPTRRVQPVWEKMAACARRVRATAALGISQKELALVKRVMARMQENLKSHQLTEESVA